MQPNIIPICMVALRKESVDRNVFGGQGQLFGNQVALRKESVDRNFDNRVALIPHQQSLSARRAWIEIKLISNVCPPVGRSLSARRAWIEILRISLSGQDSRSLSARRAWIEIL